MNQAHEAGHFGVTAVWKRLSRDGHTWPNMLNDIRTHIQACIPCQQYNIAKTGFHPRVHPSITLPWDHLLIDLVQFKPTATTSAHALVVIDVFTNFLILRPLPGITGEDVAKRIA